MYIDKIDDLIFGASSIIEDFYYINIKNNNKFKKILKEQNFIKYQNEISTIIMNYILQIPQDKIDELIKTSEGDIYFKNLIKKYL